MALVLEKEEMAIPVPEAFVSAPLPLSIVPFFRRRKRVLGRYQTLPFESMANFISVLGSLIMWFIVPGLTVKIVCVPVPASVISIAVDAFAFAIVVATLKVVFDSFIIKYTVDVVIPAGRVPVVVKYIAVPVIKSLILEALVHISVESLAVNVDDNDA